MTCCTRTKDVCASQCLRNQMLPHGGRAWACVYFHSFIHSFIHPYLSDEQSQVGPSQLRS